MPDKPLWLHRLPEAIRRLETVDDPWVDRARLQSVLQVGRRRAQQLLACVPTRVVGTSRVALATEVITYLKQAANGETARYDARRRKQMWATLGDPPVLVEVSGSVVRRLARSDFEGLPDGVELGPGTIVVRFATPNEALEKLVALAIAIGSNREAFDTLVSIT
jgi:hypothetical protein